METKSTKSLIYVCPTCGGDGIKIYETMPPRHGSDYGSFTSDICPTCKGERLIEIIETTSINIKPYKSKKI